MGIKISDLQLGLNLTLPNAYLRIEHLSGGKREGYWNYLVNVYGNKQLAQSDYPPPSLSFNMAIPFEDGNPIKLGYTAIKQEGKLQQLLQLSYSSQTDD